VTTAVSHSLVQAQDQIDQDVLVRRQQLVAVHQAR